ncbi:ATP-grasp domain-containing protein [Microbulbifer sp.]|uniref:ATP-grasp domain-containing protein n=1 Tax=Microbulbifer sp. TaxID=1908541 RepID=UPI00258C948B|nr:ATP-grasp domain-containing protein [Microbulbifer sp.]
MTKVIVIGAKDHTVNCLNEIGLTAVLVQKPGTVSEYLTRIAVEIFYCDYEDEEEALKTVEKIMEKHLVAGVFSFTELGLYPCALAAERLSIRSNCNLNAVLLSRDKYRMRELIKETELNNIDFKLVGEVEELTCFFNQIAAPVIVKPQQGRGSRGVFLVENECQLSLALQHARKYSDGEPIAERYVGGEEYSVESLSKNGDHTVLAITKKTTTGAPHFVELSHIQPAPLGETIRKSIEDTIELLLTKIGHLTGPAHTEIKIESGKIYIIETHTRVGGDNIWKLTYLRTGVDVFKETFVSVLGLEPVNSLAITRVNAGVVKFILHESIEVNSIAGLDSAASIEGVDCLELNVRIGDRIKNPTNSHDRLGYVVGLGDSIADAERIADRAINCIRLN